MCVMRFIRRVKYNFNYIGVLFSPFKGLKLKWYLGNIQMGTPYFLPRKWVKFSKNEIHEKCVNYSLTKLEKEPNKTKNELYQEAYDEYKDMSHAKYIKYFGINMWGLGWKTKYDDYRFEYNPGLSFVLFGKQLLITVLPNIKDDTSGFDEYWEGYLTYKYETDEKDNTENRLLQLFKLFSMTVTVYKKDNVKYEKDYYPIVLKKKYHKLYYQFLENHKSFEEWVQAINKEE